MKRIFCIALFGMIGPGAALAQNANVSFNAPAVEQSAPVEVTADELSVDQNKGTATFAGNVVVGQGQMRLSANEITVNYLVENGAATGAIERLVATGDVTLANGAEAAEAQKAVYVIGTGEVVMTGQVLLTQGPSGLSGEKLIVDLRTGTGRISGRVRTVFQTGSDQ